MESAIYRGTLSHIRDCKPKHRFRYRMRLFYLDLDQLPTLLSQSHWWRGRLAQFRRHDYLPDYEGSLKQAVCALIAERTGARFVGRIFLLSAPRVLGIGFNPLSLFYCFDGDGHLQFVIAEVRNTPWLQRHAYLLDLRHREQPEPHDKAFHVSPFLDMTQRYHWYLPEPGDALQVGIQNKTDQGTVFRAALVLEKAATLNAATLDRELWSHWPQGLKTLIGIYWQAVRLLIKRAPFFSHPGAATDDVAPALEKKS
ncbi:DUF1365 domain-containing protein [Permianibacter aggregans]|uniref:DUF1365 family protein n=1 Tax=Permianibacter aggregans TaxID=1510150 RepID=A0A4R6UPT0_9GAMM|nr:DUF1365 domain-containing protein [Permianibacter aggregans]QGX39122.1 DUF1365 domain-containing protein [Permianibacter aggregans]TDQ47669.1 hypothetical protein EV696_10973 [Permianibacter aggregans]